VSRRAKPKIREEDLHGFKHFKLLLPIMEGLHREGCARDRAGNRKLHYDQYAALILLYFFNPIVSSLRAIQQTSELKKVQRLLGCPRASLGSLSEAARVFDADLLRGIIADLVDTLEPIRKTTAFHDIEGVLTLVDGSLLPALPRLVEAMWLNETNKAFKLHTHFELLKGVPTRMDLTDANTAERRVLKACLERDRVYVLDRGYGEYELFRKIIDVGSSLVCRIPDHWAFEELEARDVSEEAAASGVVGDSLIRFQGVRAVRAGLSDQRLRLVELRCTPHRKRTGHTGRGGPEQGQTLRIVTDITQVPPEVIGLIYKHRWAIETFFRFFKHVLGCRHLLSYCVNGIEIQTYVAIIACLLIALWTGRKPTLRTYEMICYYFTGLADEDELLAHIQKLQAQS